MDAQVIEMFRGYRLDPKSEAVRIASEALRRTGHEPQLSPRAAAATPTRWSPSGYEAVLLANGTEANHTPEELVTEARSWRCSRCARPRRRAAKSRDDAGLGVLKLRRGIVTRSDPLRVRVGEEERPAWADEALVGEVREGDEVIVNTEARDLGLGSGGFDVVHVNLTRGLDRPGRRGGHGTEAELHVAAAPRGARSRLASTRGLLVGSRFSCSRFMGSSPRPPGPRRADPPS